MVRGGVIFVRRRTGSARRYLGGEAGTARLLAGACPRGPGDGDGCDGGLHLLEEGGGRDGPPAGRRVAAKRAWAWGPAQRAPAPSARPVAHVPQRRELPRSSAAAHARGRRRRAARRPVRFPGLSAASSPGSHEKFYMADRETALPPPPFSEERRQAPLDPSLPPSLPRFIRRAEPSQPPMLVSGRRGAAGAASGPWLRPIRGRGAAAAAATSLGNLVERGRGGRGAWKRRCAAGQSSSTPSPCAYMVASWYLAAGGNERRKGFKGPRGARTPAALSHESTSV